MQLSGLKGGGGGLLQVGGGFQGGGGGGIGRGVGRICCSAASGGGGGGQRCEGGKVIWSACSSAPYNLPASSHPLITVHSSFTGAASLPKAPHLARLGCGAEQ